MAYKFPSDGWVAAYRDAINGSEEYREAGASWDKGVVALICTAQPDIGIEEDTGIWLDLLHGECREASIVSAEKALTAPFCITAQYSRWKQVIKNKLDPIKGMMQGKLRLKGDLPTIVRFVKASNALVSCAGLVDTEFPDE